MLSVVLTVLKIIGIVLLVIILTVLFLLALVLFVPIRYRLDGDIPETELENGFDPKSIFARFRFSWLLHIISGGITYPDQMEFEVKIFGIRILPKKEKGNKKDSKSDKNDAKDEIKEDEKGRKSDKKDTKEKEALDLTDKEEGFDTSEHNDDSTADNAGNNYDSTADNTGNYGVITVEGSGNSEKTSEESRKKEIEESDLVVKKQGKKADNIIYIDASDNQADVTDDTDGNSGSQETAVLKGNGNSEESADSKERADSEENDVEYEEESDKKSFFEVLSDIFSKIINILKTPQNVFEKIKYTISRLYDKIKMIKSTLESETFQRAYALVKGKLLRLIKMILPDKCDVRLLFGSGDPATTAQIIGAYGLMYPILGKKLSYEPDFERQVVKLDAHMKGHITIFTIVYCAAVCYFNKDVKKVIARFKKIKNS